MRKPTLKDISDVQIILDDAKENKIGKKLADALKDIRPECYNKAMILAKDFIVNPTIVKNKKGDQTVLVFSKIKETNEICPNPEDIDALPDQYRWDMVCQIWNQLNMSTDEIENL